MKLIRLDSLFKVEYGNKFDLNKMIKTKLTEKAISFIGRTAQNNGVVAYVEQLEKEHPYPSGYITVALGGSALSSFVQQSNFYTAQNISVLKPLEEMNLYIKLYYCLCIEANRFRYSTFGREANRTLCSLLVPCLKEIPKWVNQCGEKAIIELKRDLIISYKNQ